MDGDGKPGERKGEKDLGKTRDFHGLNRTLAWKKRKTSSELEI